MKVENIHMALENNTPNNNANTTKNTLLNVKLSLSASEVRRIMNWYIDSAETHKRHDCEIFTYLVEEWELAQNKGNNDG